MPEQVTDQTKAMEDGYIFREKPLKTIPNGIIQVSQAKADKTGNCLSDGPLREDEGSCFLYVKFTNLAESVFGLSAGRLKYLKGTKSNFLSCNGTSFSDKQRFSNRWEKEASQKDLIYILSGAEGDYVSDTVYYIQD
ncbi:Protein of unknown function [Pyronema omphalodes CBS 100304]|uniref:Uncharacterized protein n=1 Tax=Pyronema omphalodes (strain CBS 100304) TaxID=1076935 RepID=U4L2U5_PYROM|nr:Protein of unknown function [Pyronema omphalodes CBS 100304]